MTGGMLHLDEGFALPKYVTPLNHCAYDVAGAVLGLHCFLL